MKKHITFALLFAAALTAQAQQGGISGEMLNQIKQSYKATPADKAIRNALGGTSINTLALNQENRADFDTEFSHKVLSKGITDQQSSGRCWLFTGLNVLRSQMIAKYGLDEMEFSQNYCFFYDQLEKANLFLQGIIDTSGKPMDDKMVEWLFKHPLSDGGQFTGVSDIIEKYGLVPKSAMVETFSSENTGKMSSLIGLKLKEFGLQLREAAATGAKPAELEKKKTEMLGTVYRMLVLTLGEPVSTFTWSLKGGEAKEYTPVSFGGFNKLFGIGGNAKEVQAAIDRLTDRNELLQTSIEDLTDTLKQSQGTKSVAAYRDAYKMQQETNSNYLQMAMAQAGYHGSHHSWNYYWGGFSQAQIDKLSGQIGRQWDGNLWSLSPEEMKALRSNVDMWTQIQNTGKGGYGGRLTEKLDDYIDQAGKLEELTDQLYEGLTGISFDGMYSSFIDNLMNMKYGAKDAAEDISEYFMRAMLSNKIGEMYSDKLKGWWEKFGKAMEDNELTEAERNALMEEYMQYMDEALALRDNLAAATGYDKTQQGGTSQSAKAGGFTAMTQDQGTKLEGMFTGGLQHWSSMDDRLESVVEKMDTAEGHLARIAENTGVSAGHLGELKEVIKKMIRDGLKVK